MTKITLPLLTFISILCLPIAAEAKCPIPTPTDQYSNNNCKDKIVIYPTAQSALSGQRVGGVIIHRKDKNKDVVVNGSNLNAATIGIGKNGAINITDNKGKTIFTNE